MSRRLIPIGAAVIGAVAAARGLAYLGTEWIRMLPEPPAVLEHRVALGALVGGLAGLVLGPWLAGWLGGLLARCVSRLQQLPAQELLAGTAGLLVGLAVSGLLILVVPKPVPLLGDFFPLLLTSALAYVAVRVSVSKWADVSHWWLRETQGRAREGHLSNGTPHRRYGGSCKILDTSVIIDGRIADIARAGFVEGTLVVPGFVLRELQYIADSADVLRRNRGRRGLDILKQMQTEGFVEIQVIDQDFEDVLEVDDKLVRLAKVMGGKVITNDFNLNKVAELHGVSVLNINELANALKPAVLPGEEMTVQVIRDGKEQGQGVAYLDDGTMVVVEGGRRYIGSEVDVTVTSVLQTSAGRMIFARPNEMPVVAANDRFRMARGTG